MGRWSFKSDADVKMDDTCSLITCEEKRQWIILVCLWFVVPLKYRGEATQCLLLSDIPDGNSMKKQIIFNSSWQLYLLNRILNYENDLVGGIKCVVETLGVDDSAQQGITRKDQA